ncbi:MAG: GAF domain-containing protein [Paracoccaceae bacterium]
MSEWLYGGEGSETQRRHLVGEVVDRLSVEMAMLSIIGIDHQFVLAHLGMPERLRDDPVLPRRDALCAIVAETGRPLAIDCGPEHPAYRGHAAIRAFGIVAYLGVPLWTGDRVVGVLAGMGRRPRRWGADAVGAIVALATTHGGTPPAMATPRSCGLAARTVLVGASRRRRARGPAETSLGTDAVALSPARD